MADFSSKDDAWFAEWTARWDAMQDAYVPGRRVAFRLIAEILAERFPQGCRVADLGAGAGALAEEILNRVPGSTVLCLDVEPFLLEACTRRLSPFADRAKVVRCDFRKEDFTTEITEHAEKDGGPRATRPTSAGPDARDSVVGRVPYATEGSRPPKPRSGAPQDSGKKDFTTEITESAEKTRCEAVVTSTTMHWFGREILQKIYTWASSMLVQSSPAQMGQTPSDRPLPRAVGPAGGSLGRKPQVHNDETENLSPVGATETAAARAAHGGLFLNADHIQPDDPDLARLALDLNEAERACLFQQTGAPTWDEFWHSLEDALGIASYYDTVARPAWGQQDGPEPGYPLAVHADLLRRAGFRHIATLWRHLTDALLVAGR